MYQDIILSLESSLVQEPVTFITDDDLSVIIKESLDEDKIPFVVKKSSKLGKHIDIHRNGVINAVVDGIYIPELDPTRGIGKRVKVITYETMNVDEEVDAYLVDDDDIALALESSDKTVLRNLDELKMFIRS